MGPLCTRRAAFGPVPRGGTVCREVRGVLASLPVPSQFSRGRQPPCSRLFPGTQPLCFRRLPHPRPPRCSLRVHHFPEPVCNPSLAPMSQAQVAVSCAEPCGGYDLHHQAPDSLLPHRSLSWSQRRALGSVSLNISNSPRINSLRPLPPILPFCSPRLNGWMGTFFGVLLP